MLEMDAKRAGIALDIAKRDLDALENGDWVPDADDAQWVCAALVFLADAIKNALTATEEGDLEHAIRLIAEAEPEATEPTMFPEDLDAASSGLWGDPDSEEGAHFDGPSASDS